MIIKKNRTTKWRVTPEGFIYVEYRKKLYLLQEDLMRFWLVLNEQMSLEDLIKIKLTSKTKLLKIILKLRTLNLIKVKYHE